MFQKKKARAVLAMLLPCCLTLLAGAGTSYDISQEYKYVDGDLVSWKAGQKISLYSGGTGSVTLALGTGSKLSKWRLYRNFQSKDKVYRIEAYDEYPADNPLTLSYSTTCQANADEGGTQHLIPYIDYIAGSVSYDLNDGGSWVDRPEDVTLAYAGKNGTATAPAADCAKRDGYALSGWNTKASGKGTGVVCGKDFTGADIGLATDGQKVTLYAQWMPNEIIVRYNGNGATGGSMADSSFTYNQAAALRKNAFTRSLVVTFSPNCSEIDEWQETATATFAEWASTAGGGNPRYGDEAKVTNPGGSQGDAVDLYAVWTDASIVLPTPSRTGYDFAGWYEKSDCTGTRRDGGSSYTPSKDSTLYAKWTQSSVTIGVSAGEGGSASAFPSGPSYAVGTDVTLTATPYDGYAFAFWQISPGTNAIVNPYVFAATETLQFRANFTNRVCTVAFDPNGGSMAEADRRRAVTYGQSVGALPAAENGSREFLGWYLDRTGGDQIVQTDAVRQDLTLYAHWGSAVQYTIAVAAEPAQGGSVAGGGEYDAGTEVSLTATANAGYSFARWSDGTQGAVRTVRVSADATYGALFTGNVYKVYFDAGEEATISGSTRKYVTYDGTYGDLPVPTWDGHAFDGWYLDGTFIASTSVVKITSNADAEARWSVRSSYTIHFDGNGATAGTMDDQRVEYGVAATLNANAFGKTGHAFGGWSWNGRTFADGATVSNLTTAAGETLTFVAQWTANAYKVKVDGATETLDATYGKPLTIAGDGLRNYVSTGLLGWTKTKGAAAAEHPVATPSKPTCASDTVVSNLTDVAGETVTLYPVWADEGALSKAAGLTNAVLVAGNTTTYMGTKVTDWMANAPYVTSTVSNQLTEATEKDAFSRSLAMAVPGSGTLTFSWCRTETRDIAPLGVSFAADTYKTLSLDPSQTNVTVKVPGSAEHTITWSVNWDPNGSMPSNRTYPFDVRVFDVRWTPGDVSADLTNTVTFVLGEHGTHAGGGDLTQRIPYGEAATAPDVAVDAGYAMRWDSAFGNVTSDMTVNAVYDLVPYAITYNDLKEADNSRNPTNFTVEDAVTFSALADVSGWHFTGWKPSGIAKGTTGSVTVTAQWEKVEVHDTYTLSFDPGANGVYGTMAPIPGCKINADVPIVCTYTNYASRGLLGWTTTKGGAKEFEPGVVNVSSTSGELKLYAVWEDAGDLSEAVGLANAVLTASKTTGWTTEWTANASDRKAECKVTAATSKATATQTSTLSMRVGGSGRVSFKWYRSKAPQNSQPILKVYVGDDERAQLSDANTAVTNTFEIAGAGEHVVKWKVANVQGYPRPACAIYVSEVRWIEGSAPVAYESASGELKSVEVPRSWTTPSGPAGFTDGEIAAAGGLGNLLQRTGEKAGGRTQSYFQDWVAGTDPKDSNSVFKVTSVTFTNGVPYLTWSPDLGDAKPERVYTVYGRTNIVDAAWVCPTNAAHRFFRVDVNLR